MGLRVFRLARGDAVVSRMQLSPRAVSGTGSSDKHADPDHREV
jgi:hypothetical protein